MQIEKKSLDFGNGHHGTLWKFAGEANWQGLNYWNPTPTGECKGHISFKPEWEDGWTVVSIDPLTLVESLLCSVCKSHGHIRNGKWEDCV